MAEFSGAAKGDDLISEASSAKLSRHNSAQEMLRRGETIFGPLEQDRQSSSKFLIILLDSIEKWSQIGTIFSDSENQQTTSSLSDTNGGSNGQKGKKAGRGLRGSDSDQNTNTSGAAVDISNLSDEYSFRNVYESLKSKDIRFPSHFQQQPPKKSFTSKFGMARGSVVPG